MKLEQIIQLDERYYMNTFGKRFPVAFTQDVYKRQGVNSAFVKPVCDNLGVPRGELTLYRTIISLVGAALMPFYGRLIRKVGCASC